MKNRERVVWVASMVLLTVSCFRLSTSLAHREDDYNFARNLVEIHRQVAANYVDPVDESHLQQSAVDGMLAQLDPFSTYVPPARREDFDRMLEGAFKGVGIQLNQLESGDWEIVSPIDGSPAHKAGAMAGDLILSVNGESIKNLRLPDVVKKIGGEPGTKVVLRVRRATGEELDLTMARADIVLPTVKGFGRKPDNSWDYYCCEDPKIAYVRITQFTSTTFDGLHDVLPDLIKDGMKGLVLDLRGNPGGQLDQAIKVVNLFIDHGVIVSTRGRSRPEHVETATKNGTLPNFPLIVLVNEHSASASEIVAGSLQDNRRAVVIGQRTYGKGSVQEVIPMEGSTGELKLTVAYYYLPSGRLVHKKKDAKEWGVEPQIVVPMDEEAEMRMNKARYEQELFRRPATKPSTRIASTQPTDPQLQRAIDTMLAAIIFEGQNALPDSPPKNAVTLPATRPQPATTTE